LAVKSYFMSTNKVWDDPTASTDILPPGNDPLADWHIKKLWCLFRKIVDHWDLDFEVERVHSRWLDMLEARSSGDPDYRGEYVNAAEVFDALLEELGKDEAVAMIYKDTIVTKENQATTRLKHAKFYVVNDFIRCFIANGGFQGFVPKARNYTGYMGGSRFQEKDPVRTGRKK
jgi:hypothetical protein